MTPSLFHVCCLSQALICEILHPTAHWTGQLDDAQDLMADALQLHAGSTKLGL